MRLTNDGIIFFSLKNNSIELATGSVTSVPPARENFATRERKL